MTPDIYIYIYLVLAWYIWFLRVHGSWFLALAWSFILGLWLLVLRSWSFALGPCRSVLGSGSLALSMWLLVLARLLVHGSWSFGAWSWALGPYIALCMHVFLGPCRAHGPWLLVLGSWSLALAWSSAFRPWLLVLGSWVFGSLAFAWYNCMALGIYIYMCVWLLCHGSLSLTLGPWLLASWYLAVVIYIYIYVYIYAYFHIVQNLIFGTCIYVYV